MNVWACALRAASSISASRRVGLAVADVVFDRVVEHQDFLRHEAEAHAQVVEADVADVGAFDQ